MKVATLAIVLGLAISTAAQTPLPMAHVHIYRLHNKLLGNALHPTLTCDASKVAKVPNGAYFEIDLTPGNHSLRIDNGNMTAAEDIDLEAGKD
jgi:hypothetical protein